MKLSVYPMVLASLAIGSALAFDDKCGDAKPKPPQADCKVALNKIDASHQYNNGVSFGEKQCVIKYVGDKPLDGAKMKSVASQIIDKCDGHKGQYGSGNCGECHVLVDHQNA